MINKLVLSGLLFSAIFVVPQAIAQDEGENDTRIEKYEDLTETEGMPMSEPMSESATEMPDMSAYDVRRTEAFSLVSSGYRGDFEEQGINSYAVFVRDYNSGSMTAEDLVNAAIEAGELSASAMEDESYLNAVDLQLDTLAES